MLLYLLLLKIDGNGFSTLFVQIYTVSFIQSQFLLSFFPSYDELLLKITFDYKLYYEFSNISDNFDELFRKARVAINKHHYYFHYSLRFRLVADPK